MAPPLQWAVGVTKKKRKKKEGGAVEFDPLLAAPDSKGHLFNSLHSARNWQDKKGLWKWIFLPQQKRDPVGDAVKEMNYDFFFFLFLNDVLERPLTGTAWLRFG